ARLLDDPGALLPQRLRPAWNSKREREALGGWLERFAESRVGRSMALACERGILRREIPFRINASGVRLVGSIDALWHEGNTVHIRDYKITAGPMDGTAEWESLYREQLLFYGHAASLAFPGSNHDIRLVYLREGREGEPIAPDRPWAEVGRMIREAASSCATGPYPPRTERCPRCFYRRDCPYRRVT
ncbi:MAG: PD-(D/E)XK nuclease family protein, partial [Synergistota bacterium]|nr:PD-(D/E)XK nuclease family protein [Synergistota bacterium]